MPVWRKEHELARVFVHYIGLLGAAISGMAVCGHITNRPELYQWNHSGIMALPTASVCFFYGVGMYLVSRREAIHAGGRQ